MANIDIATPLKRVKISISEELTPETEKLFLEILRRFQKPSSTPLCQVSTALGVPAGCSTTRVFPGEVRLVCQLGAAPRALPLMSSRASEASREISRCLAEAFA